MRFKVKTANDQAATTIEGAYKVADSGVLFIKPDRGNPVALSPSGWLSVEALDARVADPFAM